MTVARLEIIRTRLQAAFSPSHLEVEDDSAAHQGHVGSRDGAGHYTVIIAADFFAGKSRVDIHRLIYAELQDLMPREIHALRIKL